jgi:hypothetical protein
VGATEAAVLARNVALSGPCAPGTIVSDVRAGSFVDSGYEFRVEVLTPPGVGVASAEESAAHGAALLRGQPGNRMTCRDAKGLLVHGQSLLSCS